jgi:energy-coupling factor transporter ATP-binding protein EcfA2
VPVEPDPSKDRPLFWEVGVRIDTNPRLALRAVSALESATRSVHGNGLRFRRLRFWEGSHSGGFPMTEGELALAFPTPNCPSMYGPESVAGTAEFLLPVGRTASGRVVGPLLEVRQGRHLAVLGETGMGKSSLLVSLCRKVVATSGLILFDPLGETARAVRDELPRMARDRVLWIAPGATPGLNALEGIGSGGADGAARRERLLNDLVHSLRRVRSGRYADSSFWGPRLEEMLTRALRAAAAFPGGTLVDAQALLASGGRGFRVVPPEAADVVRDLGDRIRSRPEDADGARRLLYEVTRSTILVQMLCDRRPTLTAAELVAPGRIVLIAGNAAEVGESTARYLLSVYLALVWAQLLARGDESKTFVVLDEAQWFVHESLAEMLRLGRRRNVHAVIASQAIRSLPEAVADAVWTNVADFVAFRGSPDEAREFARAAPGVRPEAVLSLSRGEAAVLLGKGNSVFWVRTAHVPDRAPGRRDPPAGSPPIDSSGSTDDPDLKPKQGSESGVEGSEEERTREVLRFIANHAGVGTGENVVQVSLSELRREVDPGGHSVRAAGAILGRSGALVRTVRDSGGTSWWIDVRHLPRLVPSSCVEDEESGSAPPQPS